VSKGGFSDASVAPSAPASRAAPAPAPVTPVEILFKPHPLYAPEARRLKIEGEVLVELLFAASGEARVLRVVRGLGHGLDENAIEAAHAIRFRPAKRGGEPTDSTAIVHIIFQLAY
jgi:TonB family protein